jgi:hypothetical protein
MAPRINTTGNAVRTVLFGIGLVVISGFLLAKHYEIDRRDIERTFRNTHNAFIVLANKTGMVDTCGNNGEFRAFSLTVYVCNNENDEVVYDTIYNTYPASLDGKEIIYSFLDQGNQERADEMLEDVYYLERFEPVTLEPPLTWNMDPFGERYWRFLFYGLRPIRHLIAAGRETGNTAYYDKMREILESFADTGMDAAYSWDDHHGVAFRTMMLVNSWWKLREAGQLPAALSDRILAMLEIHGDFLLDPAHYEENYNHGITQATALLILAESFPDLGNAPIWRATALERIESGLRDVIDDDGVLVENSPYYHFYVLEKYWEIERYAEEHNIDVSEDFQNTINAMIRHAVYVLQPDHDLPLLGASIPRPIQRSGEFREIANASPEFRYVMSQGNEGIVPEFQHIFFPSSGIAILRSGWGKERAYEDELHLVFDTGPYRTDHSDYDALGFSLYAQGHRMLQDAGLFTYEENNPYFNYFHGTRGHNTVMVDNANQPTGSGVAAPLESGEGYAYIAAYHDLYAGVRHHRIIMTIEEGGVLLVDMLRSQTPHTYSQLFHLPPEATLTQVQDAEVRATIRDGNESVPVTLTQLGSTPGLEQWHDDRDAIRGLCATAYETAVGCPEIAFTHSGANADYITLVRIGNAVNDYRVAYANDVVTITTPQRSYDIHIQEPASGIFDSSFITLQIETEERSQTVPGLWERIVDFFTFGN